MQSLTAAPRDAFTAAQVTALLTGAQLHVTAGCELLTTALTVTADITADFEGGTISRDMGKAVHGSAKLRLARALTWGVDLVRPYMVLTNGIITARFNCGVYALTTPESVVGVTPQTYDVQGYDRLYLLRRPVGDTYTVVSGTGYLAAIRSAITAAGLSGISLDGTAEAKTLPTDMSWPLTANAPATWLAVINDLLAAVGYRGLWADENGLYRSEPYANPTVRAPEFTFGTGAASVVGVSRTAVQDVWATPNRWVFVQRNTAAAPVAGTGLYQVDNVSNGPTSQNARGLIWTKVVDLDAADQASLTTQGDIIVAADGRSHATIKLTTGPFPVAGHADVFTYSDPSYGGDVKVQAATWSYDIAGSDVTWAWDVVA